MACCNGHSTRANEICVDCEIPQLARNCYFTGKLLVERDYVDEQRFMLGKEWRHNQRLHGWGTVCGLKVIQHPNPGCRNQYVVIDPGTAIDCCGHEILIRDEEVFDFRSAFRAQWKTQFGASAEPDTKPHRLQICLRYRECSTEPIPSLFDDCGCDDSGCRPNRIRESHELSLQLDAPQIVPDPQGIDMGWHCTISKPDHPKRILRHGKWIYILTAGPDAAIFSVDKDTGAVKVPVSFASTSGLDLAISANGKSLYVALHASVDADPKVIVLDAMDLATAPSSSASLAGATTGEIRLAVVPDGRIFAASPLQNKLFVFDSVLTAQPDVPVGSSPVAVAMAGAYLYTANSASGDFSAVKLADSSVVTSPVAEGSQPIAISVASTSAGDNLAIVDQKLDALYLIGWRPDAVSPDPTVVPLGSPVKSFAHAPVDAVYSTGGKWVFVLEKDTTDSKAYVQLVDALAVENSLPAQLGGIIPIGENPLDIALAADGSQLYVSYDGDGESDPGSVAVVSISESNCCDIFKRVLDRCPDCEAAKCIVLATVEEYIYGSAITDALLDNRTDRRILPSTALLAEAIECLCLSTGPTPPPASTPEPTPPTPPKPVVLDDLTHVVAITWPHDGTTEPPKLIVKREGADPLTGIVVGFDKNVRNEDIHPRSFTILRAVVDEDTLTQTWTEMIGLTTGAHLKLSPPNAGGGSTVVALMSQEAPRKPNVGVNGALFMPKRGFPPGDYRVLVSGDFIEDARFDTHQNPIPGKAVDGNNLPTWVPTRKSGDGIEGGTFESWFTVEKQG